MEPSETNRSVYYKVVKTVLNSFFFSLFLLWIIIWFIMIQVFSYFSVFLVWLRISWKACFCLVCDHKHFIAMGCRVPGSMCTVVFVLQVSVFCYKNRCPPSTQSGLSSWKCVSKLNSNTLFLSTVTTKIPKMTYRNINCHLILRMHGWILAAFYFSGFPRYWETGKKSGMLKCSSPGRESREKVGNSTLCNL